MSEDCHMSPVQLEEARESIRATTQRLAAMEDLQKMCSRCRTRMYGDFVLGRITLEEYNKRADQFMLEALSLEEMRLQRR